MKQHTPIFPRRAICLAAAMFSLAAGAQAAKFNADVTTQVNGMYPQLETIYKDLHAHPEIAFQEVNTAAKLAAEMRKLGFEVTEKVGKTGVVAMYKNGAGPVVMVRTELDALPLEEKTGLPYASKAHATLNGVDTMVDHACGHDIHMAAWLGTARTLLAMKSQWHGTLMFIAQPAEEVGGGAQGMLDDGLYTRFARPNYAFALHSWPTAYGTVGYNNGVVSSSVNSIEITFKGRGGHGSAPDQSIDPITIASRFVVDVQTLISREKDPKEFGVVTIGAINGGTVGNIIPDTVRVRGTIRAYSQDVRAKLLAGVRRVANASAAMANAPAPEISLDGTGEAIVNSDALVTKMDVVMRDAFGDKAGRMPAMTASEDYSAFEGEGIQSMYFFTGVYPPEAVAEAAKPGGKPLAFNHSPYYAPVPEPTIKTAVTSMSLAVLNVMAR